MTYNNYLTAPVILLFAVLLDKWLGEPKRFHPLAGFGRLALWCETLMRKPAPTVETDKVVRIKGVLSVLFLLLPFVLISAALAAIPGWGMLFQAVLLYFSIGATSLARHARAVANAMERNDLDLARSSVAMIVSRDTSAMQESDIARATVESVLENGSDAVFAALFWFLLLGAPGAVMYRLANTLDAMWGYRTVRYLHFGWGAARIDDVLNWVPARLTALTYTLLGNLPAAWRCWRSQGRLWYSPNAGPVMAAGAGALAIELGGPATYHGVTKDRPVLGEGREPCAADIERAISLVQRGLWLWVTLVVSGGMILA